MRRFLPFPLLLSVVLDAQNFPDYRARYDNFEENDARAFAHVNPYIAKAKKEKNYYELSQAYKDAVSFTPTHKLAYADSLIRAASYTRDRDLISSAYLTKGTVYYFTYRKFQPALDEYLKAWQYSKDSQNQYLHYKNLYHLGVVKSYLGYYEEALDIFRQCDRFFEKAQVLREPPNVKFNRRKGYLNTLHQRAVCLIELSRPEEAAALVTIGLAKSNESDFYLERSYFHKLKGIIAYHRGQDRAATQSLNNALAGIEKKDDFMNASIIYFYKGKTYLRHGNKKEALQNFTKVDSVFRQHNFIWPQVRESYETLISSYHNTGDKEQELYFTAQLLKADRILAGDFRYLSGKIHKDYDTQDLLAVKRRLEGTTRYLYWGAGLLGTAMLAVILLYYRSRRKESVLPGGSPGIAEENPRKRTGESRNPQDYGAKVPDAVASAVLAQLELLEKNNFFIERGISVRKLAPQLKTNTTYLSIIINEYKGCHFSTYIRRLRIEYATERMRKSKMWRHFKVSDLARDCGFADRNNFLEAFYEFTKMTPAQYAEHLKDVPTTEQ